MWFTADDWQTRVTAARRMHDAGQRRRPVLDYVVDATATIPHPRRPRPRSPPPGRSRPDREGGVMSDRQVADRADRASMSSRIRRQKIGADRRGALEFDGKWSWVGRMANRAGRTKRPVGVGQTARKLTVRLDPDALDVAEQAAEALGISRDAFLSRLLSRQREYLDPRGRPIWWSDPVPTDQEELPLTQSA